MAGVMPIILGSGINRVAASATISANTSNYTLDTGKAPGYSAGNAGKTDMTLTINPSIYISSGSTGSYALTVDTSWNVGDTVTIVNNGIIVGKGGDGGRGKEGSNSGTNGSSGGPALLVQRALTMNNLNRIAGGGGGGGGGDISTDGEYFASGGGGGGGIGNSSGGPGGTSGQNGNPGNGGNLTSAGNGGAGGGVGLLPIPGGTGGPGGGYGSAGSQGASTGNSGSTGTSGRPGGAAGACIVGNSNITYTNTGTRNGSIS